MSDISSCVRASRALVACSTRYTIARVDGTMSDAPADEQTDYILIAEDDGLVARSLQRIVARVAPVRVAGSVEEAMPLALDPNCGALVLDVNLHGEDGLDVLRALRARRIFMSAMILTGILDGALSREALTLDAAYVVKPCEPPALRLFLERALGARVARSRMLATVLGTYVLQFKLTPTEAEILRRCVHIGTRRAFAEDDERTTGTLKKHIANILTKTGARTMNELVASVFRDSCPADRPA